MLGRLWRNRRRKRRLTARPYRGLPRGWFYSRRLEYEELSEDGPEVQAYDELAAVWNEYASANAPDYAFYLRDLAASRGLELKAVLDLACGAGYHTAQIAEYAPEVIGVDAGEKVLPLVAERPIRARRFL